MNNSDKILSDLIDKMKFDDNHINRVEVDWNKRLENARKYNADHFVEKHGTKTIVVTQANFKCRYKKCDGSGMIVTAYPPYVYREDYPYSLEVATKCICNGGTEANEFRKVRSMIPFEFLDKHAKDFDWTLYNADISNQKIMANNFILKFKDFEKSGKWLYISSDKTGSGKTMLACCLANELIERGYESKCISTIDMIDMCKRSSSKEDKEAYKDDINKIFKTDVLIIDDIGCEKGNEWYNDLIARLIKSRKDENKVIIFTSSILPINLKLDDKTIGVICESTIEIRLPSESIRLKLADENNNKFLASLGIN